MRDLTAERELPLADLAPRWEAAIDADPALAPPDGLHPEAGAAARVVAPPLAADRRGGRAGLLTRPQAGAGAQPAGPRPDSRRIQSRPAAKPSSTPVTFRIRSSISKCR